MQQPSLPLFAPLTAQSSFYSAVGAESPRVFHKSPNLVLRQAQDERFRFKSVRDEPVEPRIRGFERLLKQALSDPPVYLFSLHSAPNLHPLQGNLCKTVPRPQRCGRSCSLSPWERVGVRVFRATTAELRKSLWQGEGKSLPQPAPDTIRGTRSGGEGGKPGTSPRSQARHAVALRGPSCPLWTIPIPSDSSLNARSPQFTPSPFPALS